MKEITEKVPGARTIYVVKISDLIYLSQFGQAQCGRNIGYALG